MGKRTPISLQDHKVAVWMLLDCKAVLRCIYLMYSLMHYVGSLLHEYNRAYATWYSLALGSPEWSRMAWERQCACLDGVKQ